MERCIRCDVDGEEVRLFDAVYEGRMGKICERCSIIENVPIIKKPDSAKLRESEKGVGVYERMKRLSGIKDLGKEKTFFREDKLKELDKNPILELPEKERLDLVYHFHWEIMKNRRRKGLSQKQLAEEISESEIAIEMIEKAKFPENAEALIRKLEQFFQVKLKKPSFEELMKVRRKDSKPVLLDLEGKELDFIPEPEIEKIDEEVEEEEPEIHCKVEMKRDSEVPLLDDEAVVECRIERPTHSLEVNEEIKEEPKLDDRGGLDIHKTNVERVTIGDLRDLHRKKIQASRQERIEEQKKIEYRQRLVEARKEELRLMRERESRELDKEIGGIELIGIEKDGIQDSEVVQEFDEELV